MKEHEWLKDTDWSELFTAKPPFKPRPKSPVPPRVRSDEELIFEEKEKSEEIILMRRNSIQNLFNGFSYDVRGVNPETPRPIEPKLSARASARSLKSIDDGYTFDSTAMFKTEEL